MREGGATVAVHGAVEARRSPRAQTTTTEAAIATFGFSQLYVSLGDIAADGTTTVRIYWKPLVTLIWLGAVVMALGGLLSLSDRRLRVGAPRPARRAGRGAGGVTAMRRACSRLGDRRRRGRGGRPRAVQPDEMLDDPALEARARALSAELRCMVCQNQSIDDSDAPLARDLRVLLRERLAAGDSDEEVLDFLVARYGEFILLKPRFNWQTALLWAAPIAVLVIGGVAIVLALRRRRSGSPAAVELTAEEKARLSEIASEKTDPAA